MAIQPVAPPHLLTVAEYLEIGEIEPGYSELVEGRLLMTPSPAPDHNPAELEMAVQLRNQLPPDSKSSWTWTSTWNSRLPRLSATSAGPI